MGADAFKMGFIKDRPMENAKIHPFARAGYVAPYVCVGAHIKQYRACADAPVQAAGSCDVCGTCYKYGATFQDANGAKFNTGLDCAAKALIEYGADPDLTATVKSAKADLMRQVRDEKNAVKREARAQAIAAERKERQARELAERDAFVVEFEQCRAELSAIAHPRPELAARGLSWADAVRWHLDGGHHRAALESMQAGLAALAGGTAKPRQIVPTIGENPRHVGKIGERVTVRGTVKGRFGFDGAYGTTWIVKIVTDEGDLVAVKTSSLNAFEEIRKDEYGNEFTHLLGVGERVAVKATVKSHESDKYERGAPVTWVQRCKAL